MSAGLQRRVWRSFLPAHAVTDTQRSALCSQLTSGHEFARSWCSCIPTIKRDLQGAGLDSGTGELDRLIFNLVKNVGCSHDRQLTRVAGIMRTLQQVDSTECRRFGAWDALEVAVSVCVCYGWGVMSYKGVSIGRKPTQRDLATNESFFNDHNKRDATNNSSRTVTFSQRFLSRASKYSGVE